MSTLNWIADLGRHRAERDRLRAGGSPRDLLPSTRAELRAEIGKVARDLAAVSGRELDPALQAEAAWFLAQLRAQAGEYEEKLARAWRWNLALAAVLLIVSLTLIAAGVL